MKFLGGGANFLGGLEVGGQEKHCFVEFLIFFENMSEIVDKIAKMSEILDKISHISKKNQKFKNLFHRFLDTI